MYTALVATSQTVAAFLRQKLEADANLSSFFDPGSGGTMVVSLANPEEMVAEQVEGLSVWLYRVVRDEDRLNDPPERESARDRRMTPLPVRLHYLVTPIVQPNVANAPELEQIILGKVLQSLHDHADFRGTDLQGDLSGTTVDLRARLEPMTLEEITRVWNALDESYQLSVSYEVSVVVVRSERVERVAPVDVAVPQSGIILERVEA
jgi:hypothetical protein